tara:strand:+ start:5382 stop:6314 length:933 start_codon:yes stop_codon:yes gene_type:complete
VTFLKNNTGIISALIVGVAIISSAFLLTKETPVHLAERAVASPSSALRDQVIEKDSDGDGLLDWEETLWGTDPFTIDTDGDGILDGEFVQNRKKDKTPEEIVNFEELSFTSQFSRTFFAEYLQYQSDGELSEQEKNSLIARLANSVEADLPAAFALSSVKTVALTDESLADYFTGIAILVADATPKDVTESELVLLESALNANDPALLSDVEKIAKGYESLAGELAQLKAPENLRANHSALITSVSRLGAIIHAFAATFEDAVYALAVLPEYEVEVERLVKALGVIGNEISNSSLNGNDNVIAAQQALGL